METFRLIKESPKSFVRTGDGEIKLANGTEQYLTCMFTHDDAINSNVKVGATIKQGDYFYDQGTFGDGKKGTYDRHLHMEIAVGKMGTNDKKSFVNKKYY